MFTSINEYRNSLSESISNSNDLLTAYQSYGFVLDRNTGGIVKDLPNGFYAIIRYADPMEEIMDTTLVVSNDDIGKYIILTGDENIKTFLDNGFADFEAAIVNDPTRADQIAQQFGFVNEAVTNEAVNPADYIGRDQAIETANALGFGFDLTNRRHSHYVFVEEINSPIISSIEYVLYKVANTTWKISSRITYTQINAETVSRMNTVADICWFEVI